MAVHSGTKFRCLVPPRLVLRVKAPQDVAAGDVWNRHRVKLVMTTQTEKIEFNANSGGMTNKAFKFEIEIPNSVALIDSRDGGKAPADPKSNENGAFGFWRQSLKKGEVGGFVVECDQVDAPKKTGKASGLAQDFQAGDIVTFSGGVFLKSRMARDPYRRFHPSAVVYEDAGKDDDRCVVVLRMGRF